MREPYRTLRDHPRKRRRWPWVVGGVGALIVAGLVMSTTPSHQPAVSTPAAQSLSPPPPTTRAAARTAPSTAAAPPTGESITVAAVIDGDTFTLADGRKVRVLGIDSCEMSTHGGKEAKAAAEGQLMNPLNAPITMSAEPGGPDKDRYDRLLRYVSLNGHDFGEHMVRYDHTGVYQGKNDASPQYVQRLYAADLDYALNPPAGRNCADPYPDTGDSNVNVGGNVSDNDDDDGDDRESRFCRRRWWC